MNKYPSIVEWRVRAFPDATLFFNSASKIIHAYTGPCRANTVGWSPFPRELLPALWSGELIRSTLDVPRMVLFCERCLCEPKVMRES